MSETNQYFLLKQYVDAAHDLAETIEDDIKKGKKISSKTVLQLSKFVKATQAFSKQLEVLNALTYEIN